MCDYSLMALPNRMARDSEDLVSFKFYTGAMGFASPVDLAPKEPPAPAPRKTFWTVLKEYFEVGDRPAIPAVCIPPGARLLLMDIPEKLQLQMGVGRIEEVTFTQVSMEENHFRDAVRFSNGRELLLQRLTAGQRVRVLSLNPEGAPVPVPIETANRF